MKINETLALLLATLLVISVGAYPVFAVQAPLTNLDRIDLDESLFVEANQKVSELGQSVLKEIAESGTKASKYLGIPYYSQCDPSWGSDVMQSCGLTICQAGCALTSYSMIQRYLGGSHNPHMVNITLGSNACPFAYYAAASAYGFTVDSFQSGTQTDNYATTYCIGSITNNLPVLVGMITASGNTHFVVAYGYNGSTVYIKDPSGVYSSLQSYLNIGWSVHRLCVYR